MTTRYISPADTAKLVRAAHPYLCQSTCGDRGIVIAYSPRHAQKILAFIGGRGSVVGISDAKTQECVRVLATERTIEETEALLRQQRSAPLLPRERAA